MAFIEIVDDGEASEALKNFYSEVANARGGVAEVLKVHSLLPETLKAHFELYRTIMFDLRRTALPRTLLEMIGITVSSANACQYCVKHHSEPLKILGFTNSQIEIIQQRDWSRANFLDRKTLTALRYAETVTRDPSSIQEIYIEELRISGYNDEQILHITLVASYFNFVNRNVLALGVELERDFELTCR